MKRKHLAIPVKLWALFWVILGTSLTTNVVLTCLPTLLGFAYLAVQRNWRLMLSFGLFYNVLAVLLFLIGFHNLHMVIFSEFYVLMFWNLSSVFIVAWDLITTPPGQLSAFLSRIHTPTPVILGLLVTFRFFPTMKAELKSVRCSMANRSLTAPLSLLIHPTASLEYVAVPLLLRCLQIADQLSVSAVTRGAETPGRRGSYYEKKMDGMDLIWLAAWPLVILVFLQLGGMRI